ncbi:surface protease GP63 [Trypanosoma cruzi]|nr:surface protease GP63 [Trypanosoma cruzi]
MRRSGPPPTAVAREVPRKGQGAMQTYTVATQDDDSGWRPIRIKVFTEDLESNKAWKKTFCEEAGETCETVLGEKVKCGAGHLLSDEKKQLYTQKIIPGAVKLHAERLLVKPTADKITVPRNMVGRVTTLILLLDIGLVVCLMLTLSSTPLLAH